MLYSLCSLLRICLIPLSLDLINSHPPRSAELLFTLFTTMSSAQASAQPATVFPQSHVGFDSITQQIEKKLLKRGFQFNVMVVGMYCGETRTDGVRA